jgi:hypothetical protein
MRRWGYSGNSGEPNAMANPGANLYFISKTATSQVGVWDMNPMALKPNTISKIPCFPIVRVKTLQYIGAKQWLLGDIVNFQQLIKTGFFQT